MKDTSEIRICKNKKCQKVLPDGYKYDYCEACRNQHAQKAKNVLKGIGTGVATAASLFFVVLSKGNKGPKE